MRSSNVTIAWIAVSVTVGVSVLIAVSVVVLLAVVYSHRKGRVMRKKRKTGESAKMCPIVIPQLIIALTLVVFSLLNWGGMLNGCDFDKWIIGLILCAAVCAGSQFFGLINNANSNNHSSADDIPETLNNGKMTRNNIILELLTVFVMFPSCVIKWRYVLLFSHSW